ncbi:MAG: hypothetical protein LBE48_03875 [Methanomassiliicoccaceae archaeon]|nr:hypothetical protein [Methanomassiliicoccaceae archaeon]
MIDPTVITFIVLLTVLASASVQDLKKREVSDTHWIILCAFSVIMMIITMPDHFFTAERMMICAGSAMIAFDILYDREWSLRLNIIFYAALAAMFVIPMITASDDSFIISSMTIPVCYVLFLLLFLTGAIKGGADVKCMISIAIIFPSYPLLFGHPLIEVPGTMISAVFSFPIAVLFLAAVLSILLMVPIAVRNIIRNDTEFPRMFTGYRMDPKDAANSHVWPMDMGTAADGEKIWVTPKIPFIVPITIAVIFIAFIGNVLFMI